MSRDRRPGRYVRARVDSDVADDDPGPAGAGAGAPEQAADTTPGPDLAAIMQELSALRAAVAAGAAGPAAAAGPAGPAGPAAGPAGYAPYAGQAGPAAGSAGPAAAGGFPGLTALLGANEPAGLGAAFAFGPEVVNAQTMLALRKAVPRYDGRVSYGVFRQDFDDLVSAYPGLTDRQRFTLLSSALDKDPKSMLEDLPERSFAALDDALRMAYHKTVHAPTEMRAFFQLSQGSDESLEEWCTRVSRAAHRAYPDTALARVEEYAVQQFISGLSVADVRSAVAGVKYPTMLSALQACCLARSRCPLPPAKRARLAAVCEATVVEGPSSTATPAASASATPAPTPASNTIVARLDELSKQVQAIVRLTQAESDPAGPAAAANNGSARGRGRGRPRGSGSRGGRGGWKGGSSSGSDGTCYSCGGKGHFKANCPHAAARPHPYAQPAVQPQPAYVPQPQVHPQVQPQAALPMAMPMAMPQYYHAALSWPVTAVPSQGQGMVAAAGPAIVAMPPPPPPSGNGK
ncbi:Retrovirus-related Pol polyprotein from transposon TNT 1-94 [Frankliniella fusca]|uniref:Retrovirus-related Pol polyprotein from transposon TNT 1-94 n=1 Tax=Frankliniella fusca TaxID=407009 RepID=A0AAE1HFC2_9NEOP|nr:Retrovirus-related Pol polyprotein from transposon TNT 1-94 [Frankliniella fusca]